MPSNDETPKKDQSTPETEDKAADKKVKVQKTEAKTDESKPELSSSEADKETPAKTSSKTGLGGRLPLRKLTAPANLKSTVIKVAAVIITLVALIVIVFGVLIYGYRSESSAVKAVSQIIPYPVERVNNRFVTYSSYLFELEANKRAYQNNAKLNNQPAVNFTSADGKKLLTQIKQHSLDKLKSDALVAQLASQKKVKVTDKEVNDLISQLYERYGGKDTLLKTLNDIYGWNLSDLKSVVRKQLLAKNLEGKVTSDPAVAATAKAKAQGILKKVKDNGDFAAIAKQSSQASDAANGGDLGFFTKGQLPDNVQAAAEALQPGQVSDILKTGYGYEIIKVVEKKDDGSIHANHILVKTIDFNEYFDGELKKAKVNTYIKV